MVPSSFTVLDALPMTVSGKVDRRALPAPDFEGGEREREFVAPRTPAEETLARIWAEVLGARRVGVTDNFFELGGDSILSIQAVSRARAAGLHLTSRDVFRHQTVADLAAAASVRTAEVPAPRRPAEEGPAPLTPVQEWFFATHGPLRHFSMSMLLDLPHDLDEPSLERALEALAAHHPALRTRFARSGDTWRQHPGEGPATGLLTHHDLSRAADPTAAREQAAEAARAAPRPGAGALLRAALFTRPGAAPGASTPPAALAAEAAQLRTVPAGCRFAAGRCRATQVNDVLLGALSRVLADWTGGERVTVLLEGHGREDDTLDLSRTVGWFTAQYPVTLAPAGPSGAPDWGATLKAVKERLRSVPRHGLSHEALARLGSPDEAARALRDVPLPQISFNYHGQWEASGGGDFTPAGEAPGRDIAPGEPLDHLLDVSAVVTGGELQITWHYSDQVHDEDTVRALADGMTRALAAITEHCARPGAGGRTPSDFPLARLDQDRLDRLVGDGRDVEDVLPLTPLQEGMLFHRLVGGPDDVYVDQAGLLLDGVADPHAFAVAWQRVTDRTPALRTCVVWEDVPVPLQVVRRDVRVPVTHLDWRDLDESERAERLARLRADDLARGIDLAAAPLMRLTLVRLPEARLHLLWTSHHLILDGWSLAQVLTEVCEEYAALTAGAEPRPPLRRPFGDYVRWLAEQDPDAARAHWQGVLAGFAEPTPLPADRPLREAHETRSADVCTAGLDEEASARLARAAREAGLTLNTVVQGAWALLLARYAAQDDVVFGTTVSGRPDDLPGVESMVGMFINTVPTRVRVDAARPAGAWLRELQDAQAGRTVRGRVAGRADPAERRAAARRMVARLPMTGPLTATELGRGDLPPTPPNYPPAARVPRERLGCLAGRALFDAATVRALAGPSCAVASPPRLRRRVRPRRLPETAVHPPHGLRARRRTGRTGRRHVRRHGPTRYRRPLRRPPRRSRTPSSACGSSTGSSPAAPSTRRCPCCACAARSTSRPCAPPWTASSHGTRRCAPRSPNRTDSPGSWCTHRTRSTSSPDDLSTAPDPRAALEELLEREAATPFDLAAGPPLRARLARTAADEHVLALAVHHIVTDGWSLGVLGRDLGELYAAARERRRPELPELPVRYADHAAWQRARTEQAERQLAHWREKLEGVPPLELPTDRPRPAVRTRDGALVTFALPAELTDRLRERGREADATLYMTLLTACTVLLSRWADQDDFAVGTVTAGRERPELHDVVGMFVNTLVLRNQVRPGMSFRALLEQVRGTVLDAFAHQDVPFERLVDALQPERDTSRTPLFQVMVALHNLGAQRLVLLRHLLGGAAAARPRPGGPPRRRGRTPGPRGVLRTDLRTTPGPGQRHPVLPA
ncbi:hypothetical protein SGLAM104S_10587 [Streptomyces glaucescens]